MSGTSDRDVRLAGARRTDAEHQIGFGQRPDVGALRRRTRLDHAASCGDLRLPIARHALFARMADKPVEIARANAIAGGHTAIELFQHYPRQIALRLRTAERDDVAMGMRLYSETIFHQGKVTVIFSEETRQMTVVLKRHDQALACNLGLG
ncbi:protein of unknown function [Hyphomicrobium sp. 1Nfss2.1]